MNSTHENYLLWRTENFLRPEFTQDASGRDAATCMTEWESKGIPLPMTTAQAKAAVLRGDPVRYTSEAQLLADLVQGKMCRDWHITEWRKGVKEKLFLPEEFLGVLGMDTAQFRGVFRREPDLTKYRQLVAFEVVQAARAFAKEEDDKDVKSS